MTTSEISRNLPHDAGPRGRWHVFGNSLPAMLAVGLAIRLVASAFAYRELLDPGRDYWEFGWETGRIAHSLATGHGFSSPLYGAEGPTAWMGPVYPYLLSLIFRLCGVFSAKSALAILAFNSLVSALTCLPLYLMARRIFGERVARWTGWAWVLYPYGTYFAASRVWETCLTAFLFTLVVWMTYSLTERRSWQYWCGYGALLAVSSLTSPVILAALPLLLAWLAYRYNTQKHLRQFTLGSSCAVLVLLLLIAPWFLRNYHTFHRFIPFRDNFWLEFHVGNNGDTSDVYIDAAHPAHSAIELDEYRRLREPAYFDLKKIEGLEFLRNHPALYAWLTARRVLFTWTGFWSFAPSYLKNEPFEIPNIVVSTILTALMLVGIRKAWRDARLPALPLIICLLAIPAVYYFTHVDPNYRHPADPEIILLAVFGVVAKTSPAGKQAEDRIAATTPA